MAIFIWGRVGTFLKQRSFPAAIILSIVFFVLAGAATTVTIFYMLETYHVSGSPASDARVLLGSAIFWLFVSVLRIRAYR